ncbi:MAG TPA: hypothetical protein VJ731_14650 [Terriglobales bacterium]|nr:hypothetical protein [Terriglobales bacterium]
MPIFIMPPFGRFRFCSALPLLKGALAVICFMALAWGYGKLVSAQASLSPSAMALQLQEDEPLKAAVGFDKFFLHDDCTGQYAPQPDTCLHDQHHQQSFTFGGKTGTVYDVTLRVRGIFEPTTISGGDTPDSKHPYFKIDGQVSTPDWSRWEIAVSNPKHSYWLNHYPSVGHIIYKEDFEETIPVAASASVVIQVIDGNDRQIDNAKNAPDRQQIIPGVVDHPLAGQMLRIDLVRVRKK